MSPIQVYKYIERQLAMGNHQRGLKFIDLLLNEDDCKKRLELYQKKASVLVLLGQETQAVAVLAQAIEEFPSSFELRFQKSLTLMNQGLYLSAQSELDLLDALYPNHPDVYLSRIEIAEWQEAYQKVIELSRHILVYTEEKYDFLMAKSRAHVKLGEFDLAIEALYQAEQEPELTSLSKGLIYSDLGYIYMLKSDYEEAQKMLEMALEYDELDSFAYCNLGYVLAQNGREQEGLDFVNAAMELDAQYSYAFKIRGQIYLLMNKNRLALMDFKLAQKMGYEIDFDEEVNILLKELMQQFN